MALDTFAASLVRVNTQSTVVADEISGIPVVRCWASVLGVAQRRVKSSMSATRQRERNVEDRSGMHLRHSLAGEW